MPRPSEHAKDESFNVRVDAELKAAFTAAAVAENKSVGQLLRGFMRAYVARRTTLASAIEARRQSQLIAACAADPDSDEAEVMRWIEEVFDTEGWVG